MLVLTRRVDEKIIIGEEQKIIAKILRVKGGRVRIGIEAPKEIKIHREEIYGKAMTMKKEEKNESQTEK